MDYLTKVFISEYWKGISLLLTSLSVFLMLIFSSMLCIISFIDHFLHPPYLTSRPKVLNSFLQRENVFRENEGFYKRKCVCLISRLIFNFSKHENKIDLVLTIVRRRCFRFLRSKASFQLLEEILFFFQPQKERLA